MEFVTSKIADVGLGPVLEGLLDTLALPSIKKLGFLFGVEGEARKLEDAFMRIQSYLRDAEEREIKEESVRQWLIELKYASYDAEDILDELKYTVLRSRQEKAIQTRKRKFQELCSQASSNIDLGPRIKDIRERLNQLINQNNSNGLHLKVMYKSERLKPSKVQIPTSSIMDESDVIGRDADIAEVVRLLLTSDGNHSSSSAGAENGIEVVPICGMGGLGKTTLAQKVYNDERVKEYFKVRGWICVSQDFNLIRLSKEILESLTESPCKLKNLNTIRVGIKEALKEKRFLLVLDDVWNENCNDWAALRAPLMSGATGSRILVTSRSRTVSSIVGTVTTHTLQGLSDDDCWSLFERQAFVEGNSDAHPKLKKIGKEIVNKCNGLPLAVKSLGGLLRYKVDAVEWEAILKSEIWSLPEERNEILPALRLSYHHLPAHLKRCFAYCWCIFQNGHKRNGDEIVRMWMAQGYIQSEGSKQLEDIGKEYLADLVSRSLLNYDYDFHCGYTMHDLTHDLARSVLGAEFLEVKYGKPHENVEKARHISALFAGKSFNFEDFYCLKSLRSLVYRFPTNNVPAEFFINVRPVRLLDFSWSGITELPESIENLIHLRYLNLSFTHIKMLPSSTTRLFNLQTLDLRHCDHLVELPRDLSNLVNLRHLLLSESNSRLISSLPRIGKLTSLQTLGEFNVRKEVGCRIDELKDMIHLRGPLTISGLENVVNVQEAMDARLKNKKELHNLQLKWKSDDVELRQDGIEKEVLKSLQPHTIIKTLGIEGYCGGTFPRWLWGSSFSNLVTVNLVKCRCHLLPPFGQLPALKRLYLRELYGLQTVGSEFYGDGTTKGFPSLERLTLDSMPDLEEWLGLGEISLKIAILNCSKLMGLPLFPATLKSAEIVRCERLSTLSRVSQVCHLTLSGGNEQIWSSLQYLTSLCSLSISKFPNIQTSLPNGLLKPLASLREIIISDCVQLPFLLEELQHLTALQFLGISECPELTSFGDEVLPTALQSLQILRCNNLNCLPQGMQNLTSLLNLTLIGCPKIHSLPEELPTTLESLVIIECPLLKEKCVDGGEYWCKISHIPNLSFDDPAISLSFIDDPDIFLCWQMKLFGWAVENGAYHSTKSILFAKPNKKMK